MFYQDKLHFGKVYHIYNRGNNKEALFKDESHYYYFLDLYKKYLHQIVHLYAYCLLPTHYHLMVRIRDLEDIENCIHDESQIWLQFRTFLGTYTRAINRAYHRTGHLFEGRYSRKIIMNDNYFFRLIVYIHQNPQNHGIVQDYKIWPFSSFNAYIRQDRRSLVAKEVLFDRDLYNTIMVTHELESIKSICEGIKKGNGFL
jgi:REP element-mobilizing transposase RayT